MYTCSVDPSLERVQIGSMQFPLGVYPVETIDPKPGYAMEFESADGAEDGSDLEEWPDRYVFDVVISCEKLPALVLQLFAMMPRRVYPILDFLGHDSFREIDPYISYDRLGVDRLIDGFRQFRGFFYEDGMCGFGAMSEEPFFYVFVDEHKIVTIRAETSLKERVEALLEAFDLQLMAEPVGVDSAAHEHRSVLLVPADQTNALAAEEIVGFLRQEWRLTLNVDPETNIDDEGNDLGVTAWRAVVRCEIDQEQPGRYAEALFWASNLSEADDIARTGVGVLVDPESEREDWVDVTILAMDRMTDEHMEAAVAELAVEVTDAPKTREPGVIVARWID